MVIGYQLWLLYSLGFHRRSGRVRAQGFSAEKVGGETREEEEERRNAARLSAVRRERKTEESRHAVLLESCLVSGLVALVVPGFLQQHPQSLLVRFRENLGVEPGVPLELIFLYEQSVLVVWVRAELGRLGEVVGSRRARRPKSEEEGGRALAEVDDDSPTLVPQQHVVTHGGSPSPLPSRARANVWNQRPSQARRIDSPRPALHSCRR